ncbi:MAG TPA: glyoxalase superfamily protein [Bacteroidota bacterium]|nr:glyoxalase superfamily protein [Bacteroidota bacterium]
MKIIPVIKCIKMEESISFYTRILGFQIKSGGFAPESPVVDLIKGESELQLSTLSGDGVLGSAVNILVDDVDKCFQECIRRGLDTSRKRESPVHQGPVNQTWGKREFYVQDPSGNTLRFVGPIN